MNRKEGLTTIRLLQQGSAQQQGTPTPGAVTPIQLTCYPLSPPLPVPRSIESETGKIELSQCSRLYGQISDLFGCAAHYTVHFIKTVF